MPDQNYVTGDEFSRWRTDFQAFQTRLENNLNGNFKGVHDRLDVLNGRTRTNSENIILLQEKVKGIEALDTKIDEVESNVINVKEHGCAQYENHKELIPVIASKTWQDWHPAAKVAAGGGGIAALAAAIELIGKLMQHFGL